MNQLAKPPTTALPPTAGVIEPGPYFRGQETAEGAQPESLFERFAWLYIFCRERLFRDDTKRMIKALWPDLSPAKKTELIELGCGPGFYSCRLAECFPQISVLGVDRSKKQLNWAREKARTRGLHNCVFERRNVLDLSSPDESFDCLIASRLFTVLPKRERAVAEMFRVLKFGGRCFVAEPRFAFWASLPLFAMWLLAALTGYKNGYREPKRASVLSGQAFQRLLRTQPWKTIKTWREGRYQYALCEKG
jgi:ubiquinone/menaquinone biosynthesis C-methylase UbiE